MPKVKRKVGRPTKRVPKTLDRLEAALTKGLPRWAACAYAKISRETFNTWLKDPAFEEQILEWEAEAMRDMVEKVKKEPKGNQYLLSRRFRSDYGDKLEVAQTGEVVVKVKVVEVDGRDAGSTPAEVAPETG